MYGFYATGDLAYSEWIRANDVRSHETCLQMARDSSRFARRPKFSVVVPVYDPDPLYLKRAVASVIGQIYDHWQLVLVDDCSPSAGVRGLLRELAESDERVTVVFREVNGHISLATNSGLRASDGEFIALLDHDDELSEQALFRAAEALNQRPDLDVLFSDEDKVDAFGNRTSPIFKAQLTPEVLYAMNAVSHLGIYRRRVLSEIGGFRAGVEGSQDYDLVLRVMERTDYSRVAHLPFVLYHWRTLVTSTAGAGDAKPYAYIAAQKALTEHFVRLGRPRVVAMPYTGFYRWWDESISKPLSVTCFVHMPGSAQRAEEAVAALKARTSGSAVNWVATPLGEGDLSAQMEKLFDAIFVMSQTKREGFLAVVDGRLMPEDPTWLRELAMQAAEPEIGMASSMLVQAETQVYLQAGVAIGPKGRPLSRFRGMPRHQGLHCARPLVTDNASMHTAALFVLRWDRVPPDLKCGPLWDLDLSLQLLDNNLRSIYTPWACLVGPHEAVPEALSRVSEEPGRRAWRLLARARDGRRRVDPFVSRFLNLSGSRVSYVSPL